jgi:hypothetical protein
VLSDIAASTTLILKELNQQLCVAGKAIRYFTKIRHNDIDAWILIAS